MWNLLLERVQLAVTVVTAMMVTGLVLILLIPVLMALLMVLVPWIIFATHKERIAKAWQWLYWDVWRKRVYTLQGLGVVVLVFGAADAAHAWLYDFNRVFFVALAVVCFISGVWLVMENRIRGGAN